MIIRPRPNFLQLFFIMRGSIVPRILPQLIGFAIYASAVVATVEIADLSLEDFTLAPFGLIAVTLSIYLGFRNSAAYDRWWEARKLWGQLVFETRSLARSTSGLIADKDAYRAFLIDALAFAHVLRAELRHVDAMADVRRLTGSPEDGLATATNQPDAVLRRMGRRLATWRADGVIDAIGFRILDERLGAFAAVQAGCERISGTPLPFAYTLLLQRTAYIVCLLLPIGLVSTTGWAAPLFTTLIAYTFFGLDALSNELEDPFGREANDLALDAMCRVLEISVFEALGEQAPAAVTANRFYFS